ncbi:hypothetical protein [Brevibacterium aurantiacum]|uniref:hypothetical protein n=1 Tax=Brevibacterium aurantiacum TaxID=273384 RepID=UPI0011AF8E06|nr:hypothetical protein [Brevibacterium aurantiacum]
MPRNPTKHVSPGLEPTSFSAVGEDFPRLLQEKYPGGVDGVSMSFVNTSRAVHSHSRWPRRFLRTRHQRHIAAKREAVSGVGWCWNSEMTAPASDPTFRA